MIHFCGELGCFGVDLLFFGNLSVWSTFFSTNAKNGTNLVESSVRDWVAIGTAKAADEARTTFNRSYVYSFTEALLVAVGSGCCVATFCSESCAGCCSAGWCCLRRALAEVGNPALGSPSRTRWTQPCRTTPWGCSAWPMRAQIQSRALLSGCFLFSLFATDFSQEKFCDQ